MICRTCGEAMSGDGFGVPWHCVYAEGWEELEPDAAPLHCKPECTCPAADMTFGRCCKAGESAR